MMSIQSTPETVCRNVYEQTAEFYRTISPQLEGNDHGYRVLYGPPIANPPILFIGYQPGGEGSDISSGEALAERAGWPAELEYATAPWCLAVRMREIWDPDLLRQCVGLNSVFLRSPGKKSWKTVPNDVRRQVTKFCSLRVRAIVDALQPRLIVMIGFRNIAEFKPTAEHLRGSWCKLYQTGHLWGYPAAEVVHLSGAHISKEDREWVVAYLKHRIPK